MVLDVHFLGEPEGRGVIGKPPFFISLYSPLYKRNIRASLTLGNLRNVDVVVFLRRSITLGPRIQLQLQRKKGRGCLQPSLVYSVVISGEQHRVYVGTELSSKSGAVIDERCNPVERLFKPEGFEGRLHSDERFHVCLTCNFNRDTELTVVESARTLKN